MLRLAAALIVVTTLGAFTDAAQARSYASHSTHAVSRPAAARASAAEAPKPAQPQASAPADSIQVKGYTTKKGRVVESYYRSKADKDTADNWSEKGNLNPVTGKKGDASEHLKCAEPAKPAAAPSDATAAPAAGASGTN